jgi:hypothetical protein
VPDVGEEGSGALLKAAVRGGEAAICLNLEADLVHLGRLRASPPGSLGARQAFADRALFVGGGERVWLTAIPDGLRGVSSSGPGSSGRGGAALPVPVT